VPQAQLRKYHLTLDEVAARIRLASVELPGGGVKADAGEVLLRTTERRDRGHEFADIVLLSEPDGTHVHVRDIATVRDGFQDNDRRAFFNGKPAVMINVYRIGDETPITVVEAAKEHVVQLQARLPAGLHAAPFYDAAEIYRDRLDLLLRNARIGLVLVLLILGLFLEARLAFWVTLGIPISFSGALLMFPAAGLSINMISLFGFIVTLGMLVDDAIVVGEAIYRHRSEGMGRLEASITGVREVARPVVFAILTTCMAFAPMLMIPGAMGKFFSVMPKLVIIVLLISLAESLFVLPAHLAHPMPWALQVVLAPYLWIMKWVAKLEAPRRLQEHVQQIYIPILRKALRWRYFTIAAGVAMFVFTAGYVAGRIPFSFIPKVGGDLVTVHLKMPVGTPASDTERITGRMTSLIESIIDEAEQAMSEPKRISRGIYGEIGATTTLEPPLEGLRGNEGSERSTVMLYLVGAEERDISTQELVERWREAIGEIPGAESLTFTYEFGVSPGKPIEVQLIHQDVHTLEAAAERLASEIRAYSGLRDIDSEVTRGKAQLDFRLTEEAVAQGLTELELARQVRAAFFGSEALRQQRGRDEVKVYVRLPDDERQSLYNVEKLIIRTPTGGEMPVSQAAIVTRGQAYTAINRIDGRRTISVTADVADESANANEINAQIRQRELPQLMADIPGLAYGFGGEQETQAETVAALGLGFVLALVAIFALLAIAFQSYSQPLLVMSAIPFGMVGAVWGHVAVGYQLSLMSMTGLIALSGVMVNDALILIVTINRYREQGMGLREAIVAGGARRFRPVLLTSLTTFFGLAPMILERSLQARFLVPMAVSLGFGVLGGTLIMLLIVPCSYLILEDAKRTAHNAMARFQGTPTIPPSSAVTFDYRE
jgi:multidrug efflux pump subunit AcrB